MPSSHHTSRVKAVGDGDKDTKDRCWSVPITMACAAFLLCMPFSSFGLFYVLFMDKFGVTREEASWPQSACSMVTHVSGLIVFVLQRYISTYHIVQLSCFVNTLALITSAFVPTVVWMTVTFGVIHGFGHGLFLTSGAIYVLLFFDKYRSAATSLMFSAWGVSAVVSQYVLSRLLDTYALDGAMLLFGGVLMHSVPIVMLAKNPSAFSVPCRRFKPALDGFDVSKSYGTEKRSTNQEEGFVTHEAMNTRQGATFIQALALFSAPAFYVLLVTIVAGDYICTEFTKTVVDYGVDKGMELSTSKQLLTFFSAGQLLGRIALPLMADLLPLCRHPQYALCFLVQCVGLVAIPFVSSYPVVAALSVLVGASQGYILCMKYVLVATYLGVHRTAACCGLVGVVMIPVSALSPRIVGL
ncbi:monocarboxylate transporter 12-like isoform X2 [Amblyomma americanum]